MPTILTWTMEQAANPLEVFWTEQQAKDFLETSPDAMFPCLTATKLRTLAAHAVKHGVDQPGRTWHQRWGSSRQHEMWAINNQRDSFGRCMLKCANCNCRMLSKSLECVKVDLETSRQALVVVHSNNKMLFNQLERAKADLKTTKTTLRATNNIVSGLHQTNQLLLLLMLFALFLVLMRLVMF